MDLSWRRLRAALSVCLAVMITACGAASAPPPALGASPQLAASETLSQPTDKERWLIDRAVAALATDCLARHGHRYTVVTTSLQSRMQQSRSELGRRYGVTDRSEVRSLGYQPPSPLRHAKRPPPAVRALLGGPDGCMSQGRSELFDRVVDATPFTLAEDLKNQAWLQARNSPEVKAAVAMWLNCMAGHGYALDDPLDPKLDRGRATAPNAAEINQGLTDIECKHATRLTSIWEEHEETSAAELARANGESLAAERRELMSVLVRSRRVLSG